MKKDISAIILAGGESRRFGGRCKEEILIGGRTILSGIVTVLNSIFSEIVIVTGARGDFPVPDGCLIAPDIFPRCGPAGGLHAGLKRISGSSAFVIACDMPFPDKGLIERQVEVFLQSTCDAVVPVLSNKPEPLHSIYSVSILPILEEILQEKTDISLAYLLKLLSVKYFTIDSRGPEARSFTNINSPSDINSVF